MWLQFLSLLENAWLNCKCIYAFRVSCFVPSGLCDTLQILRVLDAAQVHEDDANRISLVIVCNGIVLASTKDRAAHLTTVVSGGMCGAFI